VLSAGQRQRIGLARALYGKPRLLFLDEPNSNLDREGDAALARTLVELKKSGHTAIVVTHRQNLLGLVDQIMVVIDGQVRAFGDRDSVLASLQAEVRPPDAVVAHPTLVRAGPQGEQIG
jgi:ABC-type protease/lipase transport system fused ATPase/permease subunit